MSNQVDIAALRAGCDECEQAQRGGIVVIPRDMRALLDAYDERDRLRADVERLKAENERLATVERAALAVDRLYAGSYHGEALTMNIIDGVAIRTGERFDALRAALTPPSGGEAQRG